MCNWVGKLLTLLQVLLDVLAAGLDLVLRTLKDFDSTCVAFADRSPSSSAFSDLVNDCKSKNTTLDAQHAKQWDLRQIETRSGIMSAGSLNEK